MKGVRFTAWLSERERDAIDKRAHEIGASSNYIVRLAIRSYFDLDVTDVTRNNRNEENLHASA